MGDHDIRFDRHRYPPLPLGRAVVGLVVAAVTGAGAVVAIAAWRNR